jgi:hypothetical protein
MLDLALFAPRREVGAYARLKKLAPGFGETKVTLFFVFCQTLRYPGEPLWLSSKVVKNEKIN